MRLRVVQTGGEGGIDQDVAQKDARSSLEKLKLKPSNETKKRVPGPLQEKREMQDLAVGRKKNQERKYLL